jgi:hypothetical protein
MLVEDPATEYGSEEEKAAAAAAAEEEATAAEEGGEPVVEPEPEPKIDLQAQLTVEREQRIRLEERLAAQETAPPAEKEKPLKIWTRQELSAAVADQTIDEDQKEEIWSKQQIDRTARVVDERMEAHDRKRDTGNIVQTDTAKYLTNHPDIRTQGTPDWTLLKDKYDYLISLGYKDNKTTELAAMSAAFGPPDPIRESTASRRQASAETSSAQAGAHEGGDRPVDIWNRVPKHLREPFKKMVADGVMTLEGVKKDIPYMKAHPS